MLVPSGYWATYCIVFLARGVAVFLNALPLVLHNVIKFETNELSFVLIFYFIEVLEKLKKKKKMCALHSERVLHFVIDLYV